VFNRRVAAALTHHLSAITGDEELKTTAFFVDLVARWKELITARTPLHALGKRNKAAFNAALETIDKTTNVFKTMKVGQKGEWKPSQTGVKAISLNARRLTRFYLEEENRKFVKLGDFTSDPI